MNMISGEKAGLMNAQREGRTAMKEIADMFQVITGVPLEMAIDAAGDPVKERALLREISRRSTLTRFIDIPVCGVCGAPVLRNGMFCPECLTDIPARMKIEQS